MTLAIASITLGLERKMTRALARQPSQGCIVFDGDDTLWQTEFLYDEARQEARSLVSSSGLDGARWEALERSIDVANVAALGFARTRFPTSCVQALQALCLEDGRVVDEGVATQIWNAASAVFSRIPPLVVGATQVLAELRGRGFRLALLTKGDSSVQWSRIRSSGLRKFFEAVLVVREKRAATLQRMITRLGCQVETSWMVGNSLRSDIQPALDAGMRAVWIDAHVWEYERTPPSPVAEGVVSVLTNLAALPTALPPT